MSKRVLSLTALLFIAAVACDKTAGRPAPNSVPQIQQAPLPTAQAPRPQNNLPNNLPQTTMNNRNGNSIHIPSLPRAPGAPGQNQSNLGNKSNGPQAPGANTVQTTGIGRELQFDNQGGPASSSLQDQTFLVDNFDDANLPKNFQTRLDPVASKRPISAQKLTTLSDDRYLTCATPDCISRINSVDDYNNFAQNCWVKTLSSDVARFEFSFGKNGDLRFLGQVGKLRYGAKNISYSYDGSRNLLISPFVAASVVNGNDVHGILVSGIPFATEDGEGIKVIMRVDAGTGRNSIKSIMSIAMLTIKLPKVAATGSKSYELGPLGTKRYVGSTLANFKPIDSAHFAAFDNPALAATGPARTTVSTQASH